MKTKQKLLAFTQGLAQGLALSLAFLPALWAPRAAANLSGASMADFTSTPIEIVQNVPPLVMLTMSMDHQYWFEAYNDFTDLTGDGDVETDYDDTFSYYGYFNPELCYRYVDANSRFEPAGAAGGTNSHYCEGTLVDAWSGNFMNWATMTRMDIVRKLLYGGYRSTDTASLTVLERAHLPTDGHAFVKYYNGPDLLKLVPYDTIRTDTQNGGDSDGVDDLDEGISICNVSYKSTGSSQGTTAATSTETPNPAPMIRVAKKNYQLWTANEVRQCTWSNENGAGGNGNNAALSGINAGSADPPLTDELKSPGGSRDQIARVKVCDPTYSVANSELDGCNSYGANLKPEGLLQRYGLPGQIRFGLMTGSYQKNISGGVLRKNVGTLTDEVNVGDGTFIAKTGTQPGIIRTLNAVRIYGYSYNAGNYFGTNSGDSCGFQQTSFTEGKCASWGNPISEIYLESLRYFKLSSGRAPTSAFNANDSGFIAGLVQDSWTTDPLNSNNFCASLNTIVFNASVSSYDDDRTNNATAGISDAAALTKTVGDGEGITGNEFFVGRTTASTNEFCSSKEVDSLGTALGLCPEAPTLRGSFHIAGLAHYAHTNDLRTPDTTYPGKQTINTFAVSLATSTPVINAYVGDAPTTREEAANAEKITILPAYRLRAGGNNANEALNTPSNDGAGSMVDFKIVTPHTEVTSAANLTPASDTGFYYGKFWMNWEDSEQGGDFDQDAWGVYEYLVDTNTTPKTIKVTTNLVSAIGGGFAQLFGFVISGTTQDGFHAFSGFRQANFTDPTGVTGCVKCSAPGSHPPVAGDQSGARSFTFTISEDGAAGVLESPLFYAAKWGGFIDGDPEGEDGFNEPDKASEWDARNTDGTPVEGGDDIPDNFFFVTNPAALEDALATIFSLILERISSGTSAAVVANDRIGNGALFQAVYDPFKKDSENNEAYWIGSLYGLWVDDKGFIREDSGVKGKLEDYLIDPVVQLFYSVTDRRTKLLRKTSSKRDTFVESGADVLEMSALQTIWNARETLADLSDETITDQRDYDETADSGRHILTWIDTDTDGAVDTGEIIDFTASNIDDSNFMWLDADTADDARDLVDWVRGKQEGMDSFRSRVLDYGGDGSTTTAGGNLEVMRLGDIVHSTPISVAEPLEAFDVLFGDASYREFRQQYAKRRQVVYVGANDGMIHAFNAGFFDVVEKKFNLSGENSEVKHPLGSELWAFIPKNLLPHLQWTAREDYTHVYYVDNDARIFDVKIFDANDPVHPGGWGTILVATMRYGGGSDETGIVIDTGQDGVGNSDANGDTRDDVKTKSAVVILDVTDPEDPPKVLAELTPDNLQFTTSTPQAVVIGDANDGDPNKWFLVFGTGPSNLGTGAYQTGDGDKYADLYIYDLSKLGDGLDDVGADQVAGLVETKSLRNNGGEDKNADVFIGDVSGVDYDFNYKSDAIYFGTVGPATDDEDVNQGGLFRISINESEDPGEWSAPFELLTGVNQPFVRAPTLQLDDRLRRWVLAASGRFEVSNDRATTQQQTLYGIIDPNKNVSDDELSVTAGDLIDVSDARVFSNGTVSLNGDTETDYTFKSLRADIVDAGGWKRDFALSDTNPSERGVSGMTAIGGLILVPAFTPDTALCTAEGSSTLLGLSFLTGTATVNGVFGDIPCDCDDGVTELPPTPMEGEGDDPEGWNRISYEGKLEDNSVTRNANSASDRGLTDDDAPSGGRACATTSTAAIVCNAIDFDDQIFNGEISWREHRNAQ